MKERASAKEIWVRVIGLPMHLWGKDFFKRVDDACKGSVVVDVDIVERCHLQWTRILVSSNKGRVPRLLHMVVGSLAYVV